jgi:hypothetical protein
MDMRICLYALVGLAPTGGGFPSRRLRAAGPWPPEAVPVPRSGRASADKRGSSRQGQAGASLLTMVKRPTAVWRANVANDLAGLAAGTLDPDEAVAISLFPDDMIRDTDEVLDRFEADVAGLVNYRYEPAGDAEIFEVIERTVKALNAVNARYNGSAYETGERELLCAHIECVLDDAGIDVDAFAGRHRMTRHEITDEWRAW